ncbi:single-stranded DNA-binding protein [Siphonobacter sp. SORGH_AS_1065]|uniref:single-stranded DNA-binding protein n=1 Tax=Siphonobacter sp. SORGH_AS_1065 TaxID=3041795 RepID=UPI00278AC896|nr:single-stranded DNA-binding protein [Siphonobacter sp. SORGH_AS_1065]MDQ1086857.1 single-strand DNA-binding protein [Siphonobacter sp. SORGH_AS_1065]
MARTFNKVTLIGNLGRDPESRTLPSGAKVTDFPVATSESYNTKNGEKVDLTTWFRAEAWDRLSDVASQYLKKGDQVYLEGRLRMEEYTDKDGNQRSALRLRVLDLQLLNNNRSDEGGFAPVSSSMSAPQQATSASQPTAMPTSNATPTTFSSSSGEEDDLPF